MKILFLAHRFPFPPHDGAKIRAFNILKHLSARHQVTLASMVRSRAEGEAGRGIEPYCAGYIMESVNAPMQRIRTVARLFSASPSSFGYFYSAPLHRTIRDCAGRGGFDLIFVYCSSMAPYVADLPGRKILDFCDMDSQKWLEYSRVRPFPLNLGYWLEGSKLARHEREFANRFDICTVATPAELTTLRSMRPSAHCDWFPNGVDTDYFAPDSTAYDPDTLCFVGRMDYYPNEECMVQFCASTLPLLRARRPALKLFIVGASPTPNVKKLGELPGVVVTGTVPDVRPYLHRSLAMVAPLSIARGTQNKILEAMAAGVPVVTSSIAAGGTDAVDGEHLFVCDRPEAYADAIVRLAENPVLRQHFAEIGRARMLSNHAWSASMQRLDAIVEHCVATPPRFAAAA